LCSKVDKLLVAHRRALLVLLSKGWHRAKTDAAKGRNHMFHA
jgi:hypothetical protein